MSEENAGLIKLGVDFMVRGLQLYAELFNPPTRVMEIIKICEERKFEENGIKERVAEFGYPVPLKLYQPKSWGGFLEDCTPHRELLSLFCQRVVLDFIAILDDELVNCYYDELEIVEKHFAECMLDNWVSWECYTFEGHFIHFTGTFAILTWISMQAACDVLLKGEYDAVVVGNYENNKKRGRRFGRPNGVWWPVIVGAKGTRVVYDKYVGIQRKESNRGKEKEKTV